MNLKYPGNFCSNSGQFKLLITEAKASKYLVIIIWDFRYCFTNILYKIYKVFRHLRCLVVFLLFARVSNRSMLAPKITLLQNVHAKPIIKNAIQ